MISLYKKSAPHRNARILPNYWAPPRPAKGAAFGIRWGYDPQTLEMLPHFPNYRIYQLPAFPTVALASSYSTNPYHNTPRALQLEIYILHQSLQNKKSTARTTSIAPAPSITLPTKNPKNNLPPPQLLPAEYPHPNYSSCPQYDRTHDQYT